jgi:ABC-type branched-subunit amino acid transport system substrate-binding protein
MISTTPIKIGFSLSLSGSLGANGQTALLAQKFWEEDVNRKVPPRKVDAAFLIDDKEEHEH